MYPHQADGIGDDSRDLSSDEEETATLTDVPSVTVTNPDGYHTPSTIFISREEQCEAMWFSSGDLIIRAGLVAFRVFREVLARCSPVLAKLLSTAQLELCDSFDGARVIEFSQTPVDVEHFLKAIFDPLSLNPKYQDNITFDTIAGVYEVSSHYRVLDFQCTALCMLSELYPTDLTVFLTEQFVPAYCCDQSIPLIVFARKHRLDWLLPLAFYRHCLEFSSTSLLYGVQYNGVVSKLSLADQKLCIDAHTTMYHTT
ncbi:hypothetical protein FB45DRAFT_1022718 [Roridomyces roridus]|uniref:BTB domain-containing protein n=1 Tax=Roridomyces roridus TaxID=1738132 RepID=A0AAD7FX65_9AGAR|nr:hypothetical protein FB45DRAFT_1022718 [Roridomyces roridus]